MTKKLTLAVPTYNGQKYIDQCLDSILCQIDSTNSAQVEILVVDNCSTDNTPAIVKNYIKNNGKLIAYQAHSKNLGYDRNIASLFEFAEGEFVHIIADDDILNENFVSTILSIICKHPELGILLSNFEIYNSKMDEAIHQLSLTDEDQYYTTAEDFLLNAKGRFGLVSSLTIKKEAWNRANPEKGIGTQYIHVYALFSIIQTYPSFIITAPMLRARHGSTNFEKKPSHSLLVPLKGITILRMYRKSISTKVINHLIFEQQKYLFSRLIHIKAVGLDRIFFVTKELIKVNYDSILFWLIAFPVLLFPFKYPFKLLLRFRNRHHPR